VSNASALIVDNSNLNVTPGQNYHSFFAYEEGRAGNEWRHDVTLDTNSGNSLGAPSVSDATATLRIGASITGGEGFEGEILEVIVFSVYPTATQITQLNTYLYERYVETPLEVLGTNLELWLQANKGITLNGSDVSAWADQSGKSNNFSQGTPLNQPAFNVGDSNWGGRPSLTLDGVDHFLSSDDTASTWNFLHDGTGGGYFSIYRLSSAQDWQSVLSTFDTAGPGFRFLARRNSDAADFGVWNDLAGVVVHDSPTLANVGQNQTALSAYEDSVATDDMIIYRNGQFVHGEETVSSPSAGSPNTTLTIGGLPGVRFSGEIIEIIAFSVYPTDGVISRLITYSNWTYPNLI
jgi:hypothetical protein